MLLFNDMPPPLYYREFTRNGRDDKDHRADQDFLNANFVDHFGKWLQTGDNASVDNFNDLINVFWGEYMLLAIRMAYLRLQIRQRRSRRR